MKVEAQRVSTLYKWCHDGQLGVVFLQKLEVLAIVKGGGGAQRVSALYKWCHDGRVSSCTG